MGDTACQPDLLAPLDPSPEDAAREVGTIDGPPGWEEGFGAGLRVWCGPLHGWKDFGELARPGAGVLLWHGGRLTVGLVWDLGRAPLRLRQAADPDADSA